MLERVDAALHRLQLPEERLEKCAETGATARLDLSGLHYEPDNTTLDVIEPAFFWTSDGFSLARSLDTAPAENGFSFPILIPLTAVQAARRTAGNRNVGKKPFERRHPATIDFRMIEYNGSSLPLWSHDEPDGLIHYYHYPSPPYRRSIAELWIYPFPWSPTTGTRPGLKRLFTLDARGLDRLAVRVYQSLEPATQEAFSGFAGQPVMITCPHGSNEYRARHLAAKAAPGTPIAGSGLQPIRGWTDQPASENMIHMPSTDPRLPDHVFSFDTALLCQAAEAVQFPTIARGWNTEKRHRYYITLWQAPNDSPERTQPIYITPWSPDNESPHAAACIMPIDTTRTIEEAERKRAGG